MWLRHTSDFRAHFSRFILQQLAAIWIAEVVESGRFEISMEVVWVQTVWWYIARSTEGKFKIQIGLPGLEFSMKLEKPLRLGGSQWPLAANSSILRQAVLKPHQESDENGRSAENALHHAESKARQKSFCMAYPSKFSKSFRYWLSACAAPSVMSQVLNVLSQGGSFGELALLYFVPRAATVQVAGQL